MRKLPKVAFLAFLLLDGLKPGLPTSASAAEDNQSDVLLSAARSELRRAVAGLGKLDPAPYFLGYSIQDQSLSVAIAEQGGLVNSTQTRLRTGDVIMRVGSPALDNTHQESRASGISSGVLPLDDDPDAVAHVLWQLTYAEYRKAAKAYLSVKTANQVHAQEEDTSPDFSQEAPHKDIVASAAERGSDPALLNQLAQRSSAIFRKYPSVYRSLVMVSEQRTRSYFLSSEGTVLSFPSALVRLAIEAQTVADDGMQLMRVETFQADRLAHLPDEAEIARRVEKMATDLNALRAAPVAEPFDGPALLSGRAAAVFFHEVLGHRLEGRHQRGEQEGQTFTKQIHQPILPLFLSVTDDPTLATLNGAGLSGWYRYDDEGIPAQRVDVIQNGVLNDFLMSRMPIKNFDKSNGHGRAQPGFLPSGRQGNLIVSSSNTVKDAQLRQRLIDEVKKQGKPYGLYFEDIQGGFTLTQRAQPQAFQVIPVMVWRVYADSRPDELVRGVDIVGTPITALNRISVTGETVETFNGVCGADSGNVPVSSSAPAMLVSEIEVQKRGHAVERPPILPPPGWENKASRSQR